MGLRRAPTFLEEEGPSKAAILFVLLVPKVEGRDPAVVVPAKFFGVASNRMIRRRGNYRYPRPSRLGQGSGKGFVGA